MTDVTKDVEMNPAAQRRILDLRVRIERMAKLLTEILERQEAADGSSHA